MNSWQSWYDSETPYDPPYLEDSHEKEESEEKPDEEADLE